MSITFPSQIKTLKASSLNNKIIYYPQVVKMKNQNLERQINQEIAHKVLQLVKDQRKNSTGPVTEMIGSYEIKNNQRNILSLTLSNYTYFYHAANGLTLLNSLTYDLESGKAYKLDDLFKPGSNYLEVLSDLIKKQIKERDIPTLLDFEEIKPDQSFYLADKTIVIYFQELELTPHFYGSPMFPIPLYKLIDLIKETSPLQRLL